ncbi:MAG: NRDE family protein [Balneolaceae bacterium]|nr:NRDE family protein [Balneolaceae bacterium]
MCLITFTYKKHPRYTLIFAANRDEFYERPTRPAQFWEEYPDVLAGKDLKAGGTWMGINRNGEFAALTNYRDPEMQKENAPSRGHLVLDFLISSDDAEEYMESVDRISDQYPGFNILTGNSSRLLYYSNKPNRILPVDPGLYGLSNHLLDTPWPKVEWAKRELSNLLQHRETIDEEQLFEILKIDIPADDEQLPDTGIPKELERAVSPIFIKTSQYGTRSSTVLLIDTDGHVTFEERRYKKGTTEVDESSRYEFDIENS